MLPCKFPFTYDGDTYNHCAEYDNNYWCAFNDNYQRRNYGWCNQDCPWERYSSNSFIRYYL